MIASTQFLWTAILITAPTNAPDEVLFDFDQRAESGAWQVVHEGATGDQPDRRFEITDEGTLHFSGKVSPEQSGESASIVSAPQNRDLSKYDGLSIRIKGDGRTYTLDIRTESQSTTGSYRRSFDTAGDTWQQVFLRFDSFEATARGQVLRDAPTLNSERIRSLGLTVSNKQAGPFQIHVDWIKAAKKTSVLKERLVTAGCATCIFETKGVTGCKLAVEIDGKHFLVKGTGIDDHGDAHAADGLCNASRQSVVSGTVRDGVFVSTALKLLPK